MSLNSINKKNEYGGDTPLDKAYNNKSPIQQAIIDLIRSKGGKRKEEEEVKPSSERINKELVHELNEKYKKEFPYGTPIVCACEKGRFEDVKLLIAGYNDVNGSNGNNNNMTLKEYVNQVGKNSWGREYTPLIMAAYNEHFQIVKYLIEQGEADPNIADSNEKNALHDAARWNEKDTELIEFLLTNMTLTSINKKNVYGGLTPLDWAYNNKSPIQQKIIDLIRSKGGKRKSEL